jgi:hypothetical protein
VVLLSGLLGADKIGALAQADIDHTRCLSLLSSWSWPFLGSEARHQRGAGGLMAPSPEAKGPAGRGVGPLKALAWPV